jgi:hypothetical protein
MKTNTPSYNSVTSITTRESLIPAVKVTDMFVQEEKFKTVNPTNKSSSKIFSPTNAPLIKHTKC